MWEILNSMIQRGKLIEWYLSSERELRVIFTSQKCNFCPFCVMNFFDEYEILQVCVNFYFAFFDNFQFRNHEISWNCRWWRFLMYFQDEMFTKPDFCWSISSNILAWNTLWIAVLLWHFSIPGTSMCIAVEWVS